jgi:putative oxidoreductase
MKNIVAWALCILLGVFFLYNAYPKLTQNPDTVGFFEMIGHGTGFLLLIGALEALGGILLFFPRFATWGGGIIAVVMIGATYTHLSSGIGSPAMAIGSLVAALVIAWLRKDQAYGLSSA